jgi:hypothetical protein
MRHGSPLESPRLEGYLPDSIVVRSLRANKNDGRETASPSIFRHFSQRPRAAFLLMPWHCPSQQ